MSMKGAVFLLIFMSGFPVYNDINVKDPLSAQRCIFFRLHPITSSCCTIFKSSSSKEKRLFLKGNWLHASLKLKYLNNVMYFLQCCICQTTSLFDKSFKETYYSNYLIDLFL